MSFLLARVVSTDGERGGVYVEVLGGNAEAATGEAPPIRQTAWSHHARRANPGCAPNSRTLSHVRGDPFAQQVLHWLVLKILRHQAQLSEAPPMPIEHHRQRRLAYTHA